jgi:hypothetical protein
VDKNQRVIGVDPGRVNIMYAVERLENGNVLEYKLTRKEYYSSSGINKLNAKVKKWNEKISDEESVFSEISLKTTQTKKWNDFFGNYSRVYKTLWSEKTKKKVGREHFRVYCLKQKAKDIFLEKMKRGDGKVIGKNNGVNKVDRDKRIGFAFGAAKFNPSGKHEMSVPTTSMSKRISSKFPLEFVDEFNTTRKCNRCHNDLIVLLDDKKHQIRGFRLCGSTECKRLVSRDRNAALNILDCFMSDVRPTDFSRINLRLKPSV